MTKITHKGLYKYTRILFRDASAPARLQCIMETLQQEHMRVFGRHPSHMQAAQLKSIRFCLTCRRSLSILHEEAGMRLQKNKCSYGLPKVEYLGHAISQQNLNPSESNKVEALVNAPAPRSVTELRSLVGPMNYYTCIYSLPHIQAAAERCIMHMALRWRVRGSSGWGEETAAEFRPASALMQSTWAIWSVPLWSGGCSVPSPEDSSEMQIPFASKKEIFATGQ